MKLVSETLSVDDYEQAVELFFERGWTDGLPVVLTSCAPSARSRRSPS